MTQIYTDEMGQNVGWKVVNQQTAGGDIPICVIRVICGQHLCGVKNLRLSVPKSLDEFCPGKHGLFNWLIV
jgi:hypothetical protein